MLFNRNLYITLSVLFLISCIPPNFSVIQSAKLIDKGQKEVTPSVTITPFSAHYGLQLAYGLSNERNIVFRYARGQNDRISQDYFAVGLKSEIRMDRSALYVPISFSIETSRSAQDSYWFIEPTLLFSKSFKFIELNPSYKVLANFDGGVDVATIGIGLSDDFSKWVLRGEAGCLGVVSTFAYNVLNNDSEDFCLPQASVGLSLNFSSWD